jgi:hypothetical protein
MDRLMERFGERDDCCQTFSLTGDYLCALAEKAGPALDAREMRTIVVMDHGSRFWDSVD